MARVRSADVRAAAEAERLSESEANWERLDRAEQLTIVQELVETRGDELRNAYQDVIGVSWGFRTKRRIRTRQTRRGKRSQVQQIVTKEPCIGFLVERKRQRPAKTRKMPSYLFTYWEIEGRRVLCAVPTDVEGLADYKIRPQSASEHVKVESGNLPTIKGVVTCLVESPFDGTRLAVSCHHVFTMSIVNQWRRASSNPRVSRLNTGDRIGELTFHGELVRPPKFSFDAALAAVENPTT